MTLQEQLTDVAKVAPPMAITGMTIAGYSMSDWVLLLTAIYTGAVSAWISSFSTAAGISSQAAADTIITQADAAHSALPVLGGLRMRKYEVINAANVGGAQTIADSILAQANAIAAQLGIS